MYTVVVYSPTCLVLGSFEVLYQSPSEVPFDGKQAVPLYCVCSGHCLEYIYEWTVNGKKVGYNSTVLWVKTPGLYHCLVVHNVTHKECLSSMISVTKTPVPDVGKKSVLPHKGGQILTLAKCPFLQLQGKDW